MIFSGCPGFQCPTEWTKINLQEGGVSWGARDDSHGRWEVASRVCGRKLKLLHRSGYVACNNHPTYKSNWGCYEHSQVGQYVAAHVTVGKGSEHAVVPYTGDPKVTLTPSSYPRGGWYILSGFNSKSPYLEFDLPHNNGHSYYCFEAGTEYHLWYGEDMTEWTESDNDGTAYTDIYITF